MANTYSTHGNGDSKYFWRYGFWEPQRTNESRNKCLVQSPTEISCPSELHVRPLQAFSVNASKSGTVEVLLPENPEEENGMPCHYRQNMSRNIELFVEPPWSGRAAFFDIHPQAMFFSINTSQQIYLVPFWYQCDGAQMGQIIKSIGKPRAQMGQVINGIGKPSESSLALLLSPTSNWVRAKFAS